MQICRRMSNVMGSLVCLALFPACSLILLMPAWTRFSRGIGDWSLGATMAFFGFFRLGELLPTSRSTWKATTDLAWGDVAVDDLQSPR